MKYNKEHIERLMLEKLLGTASPMEVQYLEELIGKDEEIRRLWEDVQAKVQPSQLRKLDEDVAWEKWNNHYGRSRRRLRYSALMVTTVLSAAVALTFYFFRPQEALKSPEVSVRADNSGQVRLVSGNGDVLDLSGQNSRKVRLGQLQLAIGEGKVSVTPTSGQPEEMSTLFVPPGLDYRIQLSDSTEVWLNAASCLRFPGYFDKSVREVYLQGEAYFKVSKDASRPFLVHTGSATVRVLGTEFNVNTYEHGVVKTALVAGSVAVEMGSTSPVVLKPGYLGIAASGKLSVMPFNSQHELSWMEGRYYFKKKSLNELASVISRWYNVQVLFDNPDIANIEISGLLRKNHPLTDFLDDLTTTSGTHYYFLDDKLHLK